MIVLVPFRDEDAKPYWAAVVAAVCGSATVPPERETELIEQAIALSEAAVKVEPSYPLPPADSPLRASLTRAVIAMQAAFHRHDQAGSTEEALHGLNMWDDMRRFAERRLAALSTAGPESAGNRRG